MIQAHGKKAVIFWNFEKKKKNIDVATVSTQGAVYEDVQKQEKLQTTSLRRSYNAKTHSGRMGGSDESPIADNSVEIRSAAKLVALRCTNGILTNLNF